MSAEPTPRTLAEIKAAVLRDEPISEAEEHRLFHERGEAIEAAVADIEERAGLRGLVTAEEGIPDGGTLSRPLTDLGLAERFLDQHAAILRYSDAHGYSVWDGRQWKRDEDGRVYELATQSIRSIYREAASAESDGARKELARFAVASEARTRIEAAVQLAGRIGGPPFNIKTTLQKFDADPYLLNVQNGILDLRQSELRPHDPAAMCSRITAAPFVAGARSELWERALVRWQPDQDVRAFLQRAFGAALIGDPQHERLFFMSGPEATGKSTCIRAVQTVLGDYAKTADFETFLRREFVSGGPRNDIARLYGSRFVASLEVDEGKRLAEGIVKALCGGDVLTARFLYQEAFEFRPTFTLYLAANHRPKANADDGALWRRICHIPFTGQIPEAERDPAVKARLCSPESGPAILAWLVEGARDYLASGLRVPPAIADATAEYRAEQDSLRDFIADATVEQTNLSAPAGDLYRRYRQWCEGTGERPMRDREFKAHMAAKGFTWQKTKHGAVYHGLAILHEDGGDGR